MPCDSHYITIRKFLLFQVGNGRGSKNVRSDFKGNVSMNTRFFIKERFIWFVFALSRPEALSLAVSNWSSLRLSFSISRKLWKYFGFKNSQVILSFNKIVTLWTILCQLIIFYKPNMVAEGSKKIWLLLIQASAISVNFLSY